TYEQLREFSVSRIADFWAAVWEYCRVIASEPYVQVVDESLPIYAIPTWFAGARLNYAENLLQRNDDGIALIGETETTSGRLTSFKQLRLLVGQCAAALKASGVAKGDRVAGLCPNTTESVIFMLATASIGAIWSSASTDFGQMGVLGEAAVAHAPDRFRQIEPKVLMSVDAVVYNGKTHDNLVKLEAVAAGLPSLEKVVIVPRTNTLSDVSAVANSVLLRDFLAPFPLQEPSFEQVAFSHPLVILFSSGTTGIPKCIVHSQGGTLIQHMKEHIIHGNMDRNDIFFYYSTTGWMMWNWLLGGLAAGSTVVLYEGNPVAPSPRRLWDLVDKYGITIFGTSAKYLQNLEESKFYPGKEYSLATLRTIYSTGSALKPSSFDFIYQHIKRDLLVGSITGGTDIVSLFAGHNYIGPVYRGEIQCRCLGMAVEAWDDSGKSVMDRPGDLVCTKPFPVMPVGFWNDKSGEKYQAAYFNQVRGVWYHGDYLEISSKTGGVLMLGRSDGTLNPAGVRFGSAEIYNIMTAFPQVADSLAVGQQTSDGERVVLFLKMAPGETYSPDLVSNIKLRIRTLLSARHVPAVIYPIADIPYTLTGKKVEVAVKKILNGEIVKPSSSLANPDSLELYVMAKSKF
ncbi:hypothetical protein HDU91_007039, partial [Kappamyces sp. JEL0680]